MLTFARKIKGIVPYWFKTGWIRAMTMPIPARSKCRLPRPACFTRRAKRGQTVKGCTPVQQPCRKTVKASTGLTCWKCRLKPKDAEADKTCYSWLFRTRIKLFIARLVYRENRLKHRRKSPEIKQHSDYRQITQRHMQYCPLMRSKLESGGKTYNVNSSMVAPFSPGKLLA